MEAALERQVRAFRSHWQSIIDRLTNILNRVRPSRNEQRFRMIGHEAFAMYRRTDEGTEGSLRNASPRRSIENEVADQCPASSHKAIDLQAEKLQASTR